MLKAKSPLLALPALAVHLWPAVLVLCLMEGRAMGHLRCERALRAGLDEGAVDLLDQTWQPRRITSL